MRGEGMSIHVMSYVWRTSKAKGSDLLLLLAIADHAHDDGCKAFPSVDHLAKKTRLSRRQTQYNMRSLVEMGELVIEENAGPKGVHMYRIPMEGGATSCTGAMIAGVQNPTKGGATHGTEGVQPIAHKPSVKPSENLNLAKMPNKTQSNRRKPETPIPDDFVLTPDMLNGAIEKGMDAKRAHYQFDRMRNWADANEVRKRDWMAQWRNWILKDIADNGSSASPDRPNQWRLNASGQMVEVEV